MNIAFVLNSFPVTTETFIINQIIDVINKGHQVTIFAYSKGENQVVHPAIKENGLLEKVVYLKAFPKSKSKRVRFLNELIASPKHNNRKILLAFNILKFGKQAVNLRMLYKAQWFLTDETFDVIHCHFAHSALPIIALKELGFLNNEKIVVTFHGYDIDPSKIDLYKTKYKALYKGCDLITYNSIYTEQLLIKAEAPKEKLVLLPVGLDVSRFKRSTVYKPTTPARLLFCGRLIPFKGPDNAIKIIALLKERNIACQLTIIGEGDMKPTLEKMVFDAGLEQEVAIVGAKPQNEIKAYLENSTLFILPGIHDPETNRAENQGLVIQEAQAMGVPVIVSTAGGIKYGLEDGVSGCVVEENDLNAFADKITSLIENPIALTAMSEAGIKYVRNHFDIRILGDKLIVYYKSILKADE